MSKIKDVSVAKLGISGMFKKEETPDTTPVIQEGLSKEELIETLSDETKEELKREIQRRQYLKAGRPPKGSTPKSGDYVRMTFLITPEKQEKLREIALKEGLFIKEVLERGIDMIIAEYENKGR